MSLIDYIKLHWQGLLTSFLLSSFITSIPWFFNWRRDRRHRKEEKQRADTAESQRDTALEKADRAIVGLSDIKDETKNLGSKIDNQTEEIEYIKDILSEQSTEKDEESSLYLSVYDNFHSVVDNMENVDIRNEGYNYRDHNVYQIEIDHPGMSGPEFIRHIRKNTDNLPIRLAEIINLYEGFQGGTELLYRIVIPNNQSFSRNTRCKAYDELQRSRADNLLINKTAGNKTAGLIRELDGIPWRR